MTRPVFNKYDFGYMVDFSDSLHWQLNLCSFIIKIRCICVLVENRLQG